MTAEEYDIALAACDRAADRFGYGNGPLCRPNDLRSAAMLHLLEARPDPEHYAVAARRAVLDYIRAVRKTRSGNEGTVVGGSDWLPSADDDAGAALSPPESAMERAESSAWSEPEPPPDEAARLAIDGRLGGCLIGLPEIEAWIVEARVLAGQTVAQIAAAVGLSTSRVSQLYWKGLERARLTPTHLLT